MVLNGKLIHPGMFDPDPSIVTLSFASIFNNINSHTLKVLRLDFLMQSIYFKIRSDISFICPVSSRAEQLQQASTWAAPSIIIILLRYEFMASNMFQHYSVLPAEQCVHLTRWSWVRIPAQSLPECYLHAPPMSAWIFLRYYAFLPQSKDIDIRLIRDSLRWSYVWAGDRMVCVCVWDGLNCPRCIPVVGSSTSTWLREDERTSCAL